MKLPMRNEVPVEETWDLTLIYPDGAALEKDFAAIREGAAKLEEKYKGKLTTAEMVDACVMDYSSLLVLLDHVGNYAELASSVDYYDTAAQQLSARCQNLYASIMAQLSFVESELADADESLLKDTIAMNTASRYYLGDLLENKPHRLSPETEKVLASLSNVFSAPYEVYNMAKLADMKFDSFTVDGKEYPLGYSLFEDDYEYTTDTSVRRAAFAAFSEKLRQYENTNAAAFNADCRQQKLLATARGYDSVFDYLLHDQKVTREMYDRQIDLITGKLAPHMRKYAALIKKLHGLDKMTFADLKLPLDPEYNPVITIPEAKERCLEGLAILGPDYQAMIREAFEKRWFDFAKNQGKTTGGFCSSPYGIGSFILLSWNERMSDLFTVAHELGHAGHFKACSEHQNILNTNVSGYLVESPSTMNELLLGRHMLSTSDDPRFKRYVLSSMIGNTFYHNFVTHLREAWFQREVYRLIDAGESVTAEILNELFRKNLEIFWGDAVELNEGAELTWMRQPHYYMGLYSYTYSAGLTLAAQVCRRIAEEGNGAVEDWKSMLRAGSTLDPIGLGKLAGVDLTTDKPLLDTIDQIGRMVDEMWKLTEEIEAADKI